MSTEQQAEVVNEEVTVSADTAESTTPTWPTFRNDETTDALTAAIALGKELLPLKVSNILATAKRRFRDQAMIIEDQQNNILESMGDTDVHGNKALKPGSKNWDKAQRKLRDLSRMTYQLTGVERISQAELEKEFGELPPAGWANIVADLGDLMDRTPAKNEPQSGIEARQQKRAQDKRRT